MVENIGANPVGFFCFEYEIPGARGKCMFKRVIRRISPCGFKEASIQIIKDFEQGCFYTAVF